MRAELISALLLYSTKCQEHGGPDQQAQILLSVLQVVPTCDNHILATVDPCCPQHGSSHLEGKVGLPGGVRLVLGLLTWNRRHKVGKPCITRYKTRFLNSWLRGF